MAVRTSDFDYDLPRERIAQHPVAARDRSRLMVLDRSTAGVGHHIFKDLPELLRAGDLVVLNDTAVIPARFDCRRRSGGMIEALFLRELAPGWWEVMLKGAGRCGAGEELAVAGDVDARLKLWERIGEGLWRVEVQPAARAVEFLEKVGRTPLPPYVRRRGKAQDQIDRQAYQTVYAARPGAVAAPTAGLHFTPELLEALRGKGIETVHVTLHVGIGTFAPVKVESPRQHRLRAEWYEVGGPAAGAIAAAKARGRRVVAVGTTSVRVLESAPAGGAISSGQGWTDIFIYPPFEFRVVDALITNFHLPRSTLLMLAAAFCAPGRTDGIGVILEAYRQAIRRRYRFYSYGDAMLIQ